MKRILLVFMVCMLLFTLGCRKQKILCTCTEDALEMCNPANDDRKVVPSSCSCGELNDIEKLEKVGWVPCEFLNESK